MWRREMECLLSVSDSIVELVPSVQQFPGGGTYEVMETRPRSDLHMNLPALKKLDAMLISILDGFRDTDFGYVDHGIVVDDYDKYASGGVLSGRPSVRQEEKWWLPCPKVPGKGLKVLNFVVCDHLLLMLVKFETGSTFFMMSKMMGLCPA